MAKFVQIQTEIHWHQRDGKSLPFFDLPDLSTVQTLIRKILFMPKKTSMTSDLPPLRKHIQPDTHTSPHVFSHQSSPKQLQLRSTESPHHLGPSSHWPHTGHPMTTLLACRLFLAGCFRLGQTKMRDYWCLLSVGVYLIRFDFAGGRIPGTTSCKYWMLIVITWCKFRLLPGG